MKFLALLSSMPFESDQILARMKNVSSTRIAGKKVYKGRISDIDILISITGIGTVNAAHSATCIVEKFPVGKIINLGAGGAYPGAGLNVGDVVIAAKEIYGDQGVMSASGLKGLTEIGIPLVQIGRKKYFNEFPLNPPSPPFFKGGNKMGKGNFNIKTGNFVTGSAASGTQKRAKELEHRFKAICENMEGAAIAHVCAIYRIPMTEIRGISNIVGIRDKRKWSLKLASENSQKAFLDMINLHG